MATNFVQVVRVSHDSFDGVNIKFMQRDIKSPSTVHEVDSVGMNRGVAEELYKQIGIALKNLRKDKNV